MRPQYHPRGHAIGPVIVLRSMLPGGIGAAKNNLIRVPSAGQAMLFRIICAATGGIVAVIQFKGRGEGRDGVNMRTALFARKDTAVQFSA
jgi:hypothetical protein